MKPPVQLLSHDSFRVVIQGHDIWFNPQLYTTAYGGPSPKVKATWCFFTELEPAYIPILLDWAKDFKRVHFIIGPLACADLACAGVPHDRLIVADPIGWSISKTISFKAIGDNLNSPSYVLSTPTGNLLFASPSFAHTDSQDAAVMCQLATRQKPRAHRIHKHSLRTRAMAWLGKALA